ncbi:MAG: PEP-CTERM sorting domain-containing protein [Planctomycetota bacterium]
MSRSARLLAAATLSTFAFHAAAAPLVSESFDYTLNANAAGQNGGTGWAVGSSWSLTPTPTSSATITEGLTFSSMPVSGNALEINEDENDDEVAFLRRSFGNAVGQNGNFYVSYLIRQSRDITPSFGNGTEFGHEFRETGATGNPFLHGRAKRSGGFSGPYEAAIAVGNNLNADTTFDLPEDQTFLAVFAYENIGLPNFTSEDTTSTFWLLSESDYDSVAAAGISKASLDTFNQASVVEFVEDPTFGTAELTPTDLFGLLAERGTVTYDEIRGGTELADVIAIPEPGSSALLAAGLACLAGRRRHAQSA